MKARELIRMLKRNGWKEVPRKKKGKGGHIKFVHPDRRDPIIVSFHGSKEVPTGTAQAILQEAGLR